MDLFLVNYIMWKKKLSKFNKDTFVVTKIPLIEYSRVI